MGQRVPIPIQAEQAVQEERRESQIHPPDPIHMAWRKHKQARQ